jgi:hypothetical protein
MTLFGARHGGQRGPALNGELRSSRLNRARAIEITRSHANMNESKPSRLKPVASLSRHRSCVVGPLARSGGPLFSFRRGRGRLLYQRGILERHVLHAPEASGVPVPVRRVPLSLAFKAYRLPHPGQPPFPARPSGRGERRPVAGPWGTMRGAVARGRAVRAARVHACKRARSTARSPLPVPRRRSEIDRGRCRAIITQFLAARWRGKEAVRTATGFIHYRCRMPISNLLLGCMDRLFCYAAQVDSPPVL